VSLYKIKQDTMIRDLHTKINLRPQIVKAIYTAAKIKGQNTETIQFAIITALRANKMMFFSK
jgi:hypothetical protein